MLDTLLKIILPPVAAYIIDRWGYNQRIAAAAKRLATKLPNATAKEIAEKAVLELNKAEINRAFVRVSLNSTKLSDRL